MAKKPATKKSPAATKTAKKCDCGEKCNCKCGGVFSSQLPFYLLIAMLVAVTTVLIISLSFNKSVREIFQPTSREYSGRFDAEKSGEKKDANELTILSAGAVIDLTNRKEDAFLLVNELGEDGSCPICDAFARRVAEYRIFANNIYRYDYKVGETSKDDERAKKSFGGCDDAPSLIYIRDGVVYDRLDDVKDESSLSSFISKYATASEEK